MHKVELVALKLQPFAGRTIEPGETFSATPQEARIVLALGRAKKAPKPKPKRVYQRRDMTADKPKRQYRRRDQVAA